MTTQPTSHPGTAQPLVTHADLPSLMQMRGETPMDSTSERARLLDRLIAAAEADKPALPEGWVLADGEPRWHDGKGRIAFSRRHAPSTTVSDWGSVTPLVTAASLVPEGMFVAPDGHDDPTIWHEAEGDDLSPRAVMTRAHYNETAFDVLAALIAAAQAERGESR